VEVTGAVGGKRTTNSIEDKKKIGDLLALFPEGGTREEYKAARGSAALSHAIVLHLEEGDPISIHLYRRHNAWPGSQRDTERRAGRDGLGEWNKEGPPSLDDLLKCAAPGGRPTPAPHSAVTGRRPSAVLGTAR